MWLGACEQQHCFAAARCVCSIRHPDSSPLANVDRRSCQYAYSHTYAYSSSAAYQHTYSAACFYQHAYPAACSYQHAHICSW